jgi:hypothetical protein
MSRPIVTSMTLRRIATILPLLGLPGSAQAADPRVDGFFGPTRAIREQAQIDFMSRYLADQDAIRALVEVTERNSQGGASGLAPDVVRAGVYDAMSVLSRVPPDSVTEPALRTQIARLAQSSRDNSADTRERAALVEARFRLAAQPAAPALPPLPAAAGRPAPSQPAPSQPAPPQPATPQPAPGQATSARYRVTVSGITVVNGVSSRGETDYISLIVIGPSGQIGPFGWGPGKLKTGDQVSLDIRSDTVRVANAPAEIRIAWTAANHEGSSEFKQVALALGNAAADLASGSGNPYTAIPGAIAKVGLSLLKGCDTQLFEGAVVVATDQLKDGQEVEGWKPTDQPGRWRRAFEYRNVASPCDTGRYRLDVDVERVASS